MSLLQLSLIVDGRCEGADVSFEAVSTDTRSIRPGELFVALDGENFDAHQFVEQAGIKGAAAAMVSRQVDADLPQVVVPDTLQALSQWASQIRQQAQVPFVAITGSNGKTSVKEMVAAILGQSGPILATQGNYNNHIGVPLTILRLRPEDRFAVIEMGANHADEIAGYCRIARPHVATVNNVGPAHLEGFGSLEGVARAKGEIFSGLDEAGTAVVNRDEPYYDYWCGLAGKRQILSFGFSDDADVQGVAGSIKSRLGAQGFVTEFGLRYQGEACRIEVPLPGVHSANNALAAAALCLALNISLDQIQRGLRSVAPVPGRMQVQTGVHGCLLINDTYNANPRSLDAALGVLSDVDAEPWLVLGDFGELGSDSAAIHVELGERVYRAGIRRFFATGDEMLGAVDQFNRCAAKANESSARAEHFVDKAALSQALKQQLNQDHVLLVKGSRSQRMDQVVEALLPKEDGACC